MRSLACRRVKKKDRNTEPHEAFHDVGATRGCVLRSRGLVMTVVCLLPEVLRIDLFGIVVTGWVCAFLCSRSILGVHRPRRGLMSFWITRQASGRSVRWRVSQM